MYRYDLMLASPSPLCSPAHSELHTYCECQKCNKMSCKVETNCEVCFLNTWHHCSTDPLEMFSQLYLVNTSIWSLFQWKKNGVPTRASGRSDWVLISDGCRCRLQIQISTLEVVPSADWHLQIDRLICRWGIILHNCFGYIKILYKFLIPHLCTLTLMSLKHSWDLMDHENIMNHPWNHKWTFKARTLGTVLELATQVKNIPPNHFPSSYT